MGRSRPSSVHNSFRRSCCENSTTILNLEKPYGKITSDDSDDSNFEITSKRRKVVPLETRVKRGSAHCSWRIRRVWKASAARTHVHAVQDAAFKNCCLRSGRYDGSKRHHFFPRVIARRALAVRAFPFLSRWPSSPGRGLQNRAGGVQLPHGTPAFAIL